MEYKDLTPEQQEKVDACKTPEDILALAKSEGYELSEDEMDQISGGLFLGWDDGFMLLHATCPICKKEYVWRKREAKPQKCPYCGI